MKRSPEQMSAWVKQLERDIDLEMQMRRTGVFKRSAYTYIPGIGNVLESEMADKPGEPSEKLQRKYPATYGDCW